MHRNDPQRGQSMLEAIVAIGIITTAVSSALTLVQSSIKAEAEAQAAVIAANLAREGAEVVRSLRDSNWLAGMPWDTDLVGAPGDVTGVPMFDPATAQWTVDFAADDIMAPEAVIYRQQEAAGNAVLGLYRQASAQPAQTIKMPFRRLLTLNSICGEGTTVATGGSGCGGLEKVGIQVLVDVQWQASGRTRTQTVEYRLFDWR